MHHLTTFSILAERGFGDVEARLLSRWKSFVDFLPLLGVGLVILVLAWILGWLVSKSPWLWRRFTKNEFLTDILCQVSRTVVMLLGLVLALDVMQASSLLGAVLGTAGLLGLVLGFAFREIFENFFASLLLSLKQPFAPNEHVKIDGEEGKVIRLTTRATVLMTLDGNHLRIPNSRVYKATILNYSRNPMRRFSFAVGVGTKEDMEVVEDAGLATLRKHPGVSDDPAPFFRIEAIGDSTISVRFYGWVDQRRFDLSRVKSLGIRAVKEAFDASDISMPEPTYRLIGAPPGPGMPDEAEPESYDDTTEVIVVPPSDVEAEEVEVDRTLDEQIEDDRRAADSPDLLQPDAPRE